MDEREELLKKDRERQKKREALRVKREQELRKKIKLLQLSRFFHCCFTKNNLSNLMISTSNSFKSANEEYPKPKSSSEHKNPHPVSVLLFS